MMWEQDAEGFAFGSPLGLDSLRLSGDVPEPGLANLEAAAAAVSRLIINNGVFDQKPFDRRQHSGRLAFAAITEGVIVGAIKTFFYKQVHTAK